MTNIIESIEKEALTLLLRSKTALGRLTDAEVHSVLEFLESIGFARPAVGAAPPAVAPIEPAPVVPPVSALSNLESIIEKDVKAFFAPLAPPPAQ
jgi:hypothetical protein